MLRGTRYSLSEGGPRRGNTVVDLMEAIKLHGRLDDITSLLSSVKWFGTAAERLRPVRVRPEEARFQPGDRIPGRAADLGPPHQLDGCAG